MTGIVLVSLLVCLIPTTIGALLSAIGIAGMDRLVQRNVLAMSGRAVEAAGDVNTLLLDKTGTITLGNRQATEFIPVGGVSETELADAAQLSSLADETPEGRSVVVLAKDEVRAARAASRASSTHATFVPFTAQTRMSGVDLAEPGGGPRDPQGRLGVGAGLGARRPAARCRPSSARSSTASPAPAARRWSSPSPARQAPGRSASSTSRTSSSRACASASTSCARWASAP